MRMHIIMHESFESPAAIELWAQKKGHKIAYTRLYKGDIFPQECDFDFLVIMGGPQSPATTTDECPYFDARKETDFVKKAIDGKKIILGVCLGAQFIGEALGARFDHSPNREIGVFPITFTQDAKQDLIFSLFPQKLMVGHWHGDMPGLTPESKVLATSEGCPRQIVRYAPMIYGFQCHFEFTPKAIEGIIMNNAHELEKYKGLPYIQTADMLRGYNYSEMNKFLFNFLDAISKL